MNCSGRDVVQMFLSSGVNVRHPDRVNHGLHLRCGQMDHNEKNWIPFQKEGRSFIVYSLVPHLVRELVYDGNGTCGKEWRTVFPKLEDIQENRLDVALRGSAQAVYVDEPDITANLMKPHFLGLFHVADLKVRRYAHYAYRFSPEPPFAILQVSKPLPLLGLPPEVGSAPFAFASGLAVHGDQVILSYAAGDREPRAMLMSLGRLDAFFQ
ncbi:unnamed protein product [Effrenium voratum]|nr:unnamed protein product [Effrenium voratum]